MRCDPESVVSGLYAAWRLQDLEATLAYFHDDLRFTSHEPDGIRGLGGNMLGKAAFRSYLIAVRNAWEFVIIRPSPFVIDGEILREHTRFSAIHRRTGLPLESSKRHVWRVRDGRVAECDEYQDAVKIDAFRRMAVARFVR